MKNFLTFLLFFIPLFAISQTCDVELLGFNKDNSTITIVVLDGENCGCNEYTQQDGNTCDESSSSVVGNNENITNLVFGLHYDDLFENTECTQSTFHPGWAYAYPINSIELETGDTATFVLNTTFNWDCLLNTEIEGECWELVVWQINLSQTVDIEDFPTEYWTDTCGTCANQTQMYPDIDLSNNSLIWCPGEIPPPPLYYGCIDPEAENYNPEASLNDGSCTYPPVLGCTNPIACNYDWMATQNDGSCVTCENTYEEGVAACGQDTWEWYINLFNCVQEGCTDPDAINYNEEADEDDGSCEYSPDAIPSAGFDETICDNGEPANSWNITVYNPNTSIYNATDTLFVYCVEIPEIGFDECQNGYEIGAYWIPPGEGQYINTVIIPESIETFTVNVYYAEDEYEGYASNNSIIVQNIIQDPGVCVFPGCTDPEANNYDPLATEDDGSCEYDITELTYIGAECVIECDQNGLYYHVITTFENTGNIQITDFCAEWNVIGADNLTECFIGVLNPGEITTLEYGPFYTDGSGIVYVYLDVLNGITLDPAIDFYENFTCLQDIDIETICIYGCTDATANNYNPIADLDDGSCEYSIYGCMDIEACNYDPNATDDDGSCDYNCYGCTDINASNYNENATIDDGSCEYDVPGCTDPAATNYNPLATVDDGSCEYIIYLGGCTDPEAANYNPMATYDDGSCYYLPEPCDGSYYAPNTFTPNNDGVNDGWTVVVADPDCWRSWYVAIYNRWGGLVWESTTVGEVWPASVFDGNHYVADGVYVYLVRGEGWNPAHTFKSTGHITIFR